MIERMSAHTYIKPARVFKLIHQCLKRRTCDENMISNKKDERGPVAEAGKGTTPFSL